MPNSEQADDLLVQRERLLQAAMRSNDEFNRALLAGKEHQACTAITNYFTAMSLLLMDKAP